MVESIEIQDFRCFRKFRLEGLKRINIVVGENGSGKTALLESLLMAADYDFLPGMKVTSDKRGRYESFPAIFISTIFRESPSENAKRFSEISKGNRDGRIIKVLNQEFPDIKDISIQFNAGTPMLYASLKSIEGERIPISLISEGVNRLLSFLIAIDIFSGGIVLIDEIENGFYYERLQALWFLMLQFCKACDTQIFATTHSMECLRALLPTLSNNKEDFSLIRMQRGEEGIEAKIFNGKSIEAALEEGTEVR